MAEQARTTNNALRTPLHDEQPTNDTPTTTNNNDKRRTNNERPANQRARQRTERTHDQHARAIGWGVRCGGVRRRHSEDTSHTLTRQARHREDTIGEDTEENRERRREEHRGRTCTLKHSFSSLPRASRVCTGMPKPRVDFARRRVLPTLREHESPRDMRPHQARRCRASGAPGRRVARMASKT